MTSSLDAKYNVHDLNTQSLSEKEFEIINIIADGFRSNQRELSSHVGLSLGMTNLLLRRLATKGFLRIRQLNRKKAEYLLTPRGIAEKTKKTVSYTIKTLQSFSLIKLQIRGIVENLMTPQTRAIVMVGEGDLADLIASELHDFCGQRVVFERVTKIPERVSADVLVLSADSDGALHEAGDVVNLIQALSGRIGQMKSSAMAIAS